MRLSKHLILVLLMVLPSLFVYLGGLYSHSHGNLFQTNLDPEYFHAMNGLIIADRELDVEYIAHPGTPLQYLIAVAARIEYLFSSGEGDIIDDFLNRPESYLRTANKLLLFLLCCSIAIAGFLIYRVFESVLVAMLTQSIMFSSYTIVGLTGRVIPAGLILMPLLLLVVLLLRRAGIGGAVSERERILWAVIVGFGIACKLTFFPMILLPLIMLSGGLKGMIRTSAYTALSFLIFAYPVVLHASEFIDWVGGMAAHSGKYGTGDESFVDLESFMYNAELLWVFDRPFFVIIALSALFATIVGVFWKREQSDLQRRLQLAIFALLACVCLSLIVTFKHYALHYFVPYFITKLTFILLWTLWLGEWKQRAAVFGKIQIIGAVLVFSMLGHQLVEVKHDLHRVAERSTRLQEGSETIRSLIGQDTPLVISGSYYGTPFEEFAFMNGLRLCGRRAGKFVRKLERKYPRSFEYVEWDKDVYHFGPMESWKGIMELGGGEFYFYHGMETADRIPEINRRLINAYDKPKIEIIFENGEEQLWLVSASL